MAREFEVKNAEEFEQLIQSQDFRVYEALVSTILKNPLKVLNVTTML